MTLKYYLGITDYVIIGASLLISAGIGIASRYFGENQNTIKLFIVAGKKMSKVPAILSLVVTVISPSTFLSTPVEIYKYGITLLTYIITLSVGIFLASWIFVPVYFQTNVYTVNEFLEYRFGKTIRCIISIVLLLQMVFYMSMALSEAVLSFNSITNLSIYFKI
nr:sodium-coupled monocarboxylate transporter 1-like [Parasteatoda tepidariorum]